MAGDHCSLTTVWDRFSVWAAAQSAYFGPYMTSSVPQCDSASTIARWVLHYAPVLKTRIRFEMRQPNRSWRVDETYVRVQGRWTYLYRAIDSAGNTIDFLLSPK